MFSLKDIRDVAVQMERNGGELYRKAARMTNDRRIAELLDWLARQEDDHARWFQSLEVDDKVEDGLVQLDALGSQMIRDAVQHQTFGLTERHLARADDLKQVLELAMQLERDTIDFYKVLQSVVGNGPAHQQLDAIIEEENRHLDQLQQVARRLDDERCQGEKKWG